MAILFWGSKIFKEGHDMVLLKSDSLGLTQELQNGKRRLAPSDLFVEDIRAFP